MAKKLLFYEDRFSLPEGVVCFQYPKKISEESFALLEEFIELRMSSLSREIDNAPDTEIIRLETAKQSSVPENQPE